MKMPTRYCDLQNDGSRGEMWWWCMYRSLASWSKEGDRRENLFRKIGWFQRGQFGEGGWRINVIHNRTLEQAFTVRLQVRMSSMKIIVCNPQRMEFHHKLQKDKSIIWLLWATLWCGVMRRDRYGILTVYSSFNDMISHMCFRFYSYRWSSSNMSNQQNPTPISYTTDAQSKDFEDQDIKTRIWKVRLDSYLPFIDIILQFQVMFKGTY